MSMQSGYIISCANIAVIEGFTQQREVAWNHYTTRHMTWKMHINSMLLTTALSQNEKAPDVNNNEELFVNILGKVQNMTKAP